MKRLQKGALILYVLLLFSSGLNALPQTAISIDPSTVSYYDAVKTAFNLTSEQETMLKSSGFVVVETPNTLGAWNPTLRFEDFYFAQVYRNDLPVFVTTDSVLHLFHVIFDCSIRKLEQETFYPLIHELTQYAFNTSLSSYNMIAHDGSLKYWAIRNATIYFAVGLSLITGQNVTLPPELLPDINFYLGQIYSDDLRFIKAGSWNLPESPYSSDVNYDFTQFKVRGHYLGVPELEKYFRTFMWYGNFPVFVPRNDERYDWTSSHIDDTAIVYMRDILKSNQQYYDDWTLLYNVTSALIGDSDSINFLNLETALNNVFGNSEQYLDLIVEDDGLTRLREELAKPAYQQKILSQALLAATDVPLPRYPIVFQFMGQRYVPDSYIFQMLCWDKVGRNSEGKRRIMPKGADVLAVLGSERAYQLLIPDHDYSGYTSNLSTLEQNFDNLTEEDWTHSSYTAWMYALQSLVDIEYQDNYPMFMRTLAWQDEKLNTGLGSWAQLRHDTILYAKQTYISGYLCSYPEAFAEPNPSFYSRMQKLCQRTSEAVNMMPPNDVTPTITGFLETLMNATQILETISTKELAGKPLSPEETGFLKNIVYGCVSGGPMGWYYSTIHRVSWWANYTSILDVPVIADVATFGPGDVEDPPQILHVADGYVNSVIVFYPRPDGTLVAAVGPVFSYYEFSLLGTYRLNDDEWKAMLSWDNRTEYTPDWLRDVYGASLPWPTSTVPVGDLTGPDTWPDGRIDMRDVAYVARRFMCVPKDLLWDSNADVNSDDKINMMDIGTVAKYFGEKLIQGTGTVKYQSFEGGFYGIVGDNGMNYDPPNLPQEFKVDGLRVQFTAKPTDYASFHMWGKVIELFSIQSLP